MIAVSMTWPQFQRGQCTVAERKVQLGPNERDIVACLLLNRGRPVSIERLIEFCYPDPDAEPEWAAGCVRTALYHLRRKIPGAIVRHANFGFVIPIERNMA